MPSTYERIESKITTTQVTDVVFTGIPQTYTDLVVVANMQGYYQSATYIDIGIRVGTGSIDTSNIYSSTIYFSDSPFGARRTSQSYVFAYCPAVPTTTPSFGQAVFNIMDYTNTTLNKTIFSRWSSIQNSNTVNNVGGAVGRWNSTNYIDQVAVSNRNGTNFYAGCVVTIYGIKGA